MFLCLLNMLQRLFARGYKISSLNLNVVFQHQAAGSVLVALRTAGEEAHEKAVDGVGDSLKSLDL